MTIGKATRKYETWLGRHTRLIDADLAHKHRAMAENAFSFLRATYYRWAQLWPRICTGLAEGPRVLAAGDLHIENFGTWRDREGRLTWGVNDFDEAFPMAYANDLARLATSAMLGIRAGHLVFQEEAACEAILAGYRQSLESSGLPFIIEEDNRWFAPLIDQQARDPIRFWGKLRGIPPLESDAPKTVVKVIRALLPEKDLPIHLGHRVAGLGSLGKPRFIALADWHGGPIAREAKALTPSACAWLAGERKPEVYYAKLMNSAIRCADPLFEVRRSWIVRRLSPECSRVELTALPKPHDDTKLLHAMGWETANVHLGSRGRRKMVLADATRRGRWLLKAARQMLDATMEDWEQWKEAYNKAALTEQEAASSARPSKGRAQSEREGK